MKQKLSKSLYELLKITQWLLIGIILHTSRLEGGKWNYYRQAAWHLS